MPLNAGGGRSGGKGYMVPIKLGSFVGQLFQIVFLLVSQRFFKCVYRFLNPVDGTEIQDG